VAKSKDNSRSPQFMQRNADVSAPPYG